MIADTNVLVRTIVADHTSQYRAAQKALTDAERIAISTATFCELVWVLSRGYQLRTDDVSKALRTLLSAEKVDADRAAVEFGLMVLERGGDFADGAIAHEGRALGGDVFVSFDKDAIRRLKEVGMEAKLLD